MPQRYVSKELTHFAGRGLSTEEKYQLLVKILNTGKLIPRWPDEEKPELDVRPSAQDFRENFVAYAVCFCDIELMTAK